MLRVEVMCLPDTADGAHRAAHVEVVARCENPAAALPESRDGLALFRREAALGLEAEEPDLVEI